MTELSELLRRHATSAREIARRAHEIGVPLSHQTAAMYWMGSQQQPTEQTLVAFHRVTGIPLQELRIAAKVPVGEGEPWEPPIEANRLSRRQRLAINELIRAMVGG